MKDIRIERLTLDHFKGQRHFELVPDGQSCAIYGDNAAGKTTLYDGLTWLLFGKDSAGKSDFEIKPLGKDGQVLDHQAITSAEAVLWVDNDRISLKKTYYEKWSTKRGSAQESFDGNTSDYYIDGVPVKKYEFDRQVSELVDEDLFRTLTNVTYFCGGMDWKSRRSILFELGQVESDKAIMSREGRFSELTEAMGSLELDGFRKKLQAERKSYVGVRNDVPTRLDECQKTVEDLSGIDFDALRRERDTRADKKTALEADLLKMENDTFLASRKNDLGRLRNELTALEQENDAYRKGQEVPAPNVGAIERETASLERTLLRLTEERRQNLSRAEEADRGVAHCREEWKRVHGEAFGGASCPACGRPLDGELLDQSRSQYESKKKEKLDGLVRDSERLKAMAQDCRKRAEEAADEAVSVENQLAQLADQRRQADGFRRPEIKDKPGFDTERNKLLAQIKDLEELVTRHTSDGQAVRGEARARIKTLEDEISAIDGTLAKQAVLDFTHQRMDDLRAQAASAAQKLEALDKLLFLCEEFVRFKTKYIEDSINGQFSIVKWKLFSEQVNGGLSECCEATVDGVPYSSLNSGMRINAGIDVISALSAFYGVRVPLVVDNAETVTALRPLDAQVIRLVVSADDKELRCDYGA